jgi:hypothetical protein
MDLAVPMIALIALIALVVFVVVAALLGRWLLEPVNRAAGHLNAPTRFMLTDFLWLMIQLQVMLAVVLVQIREQVPQVGQFVILGILAVPVVVLWAASVSVVSRAGITQPLRRAVLILVLVPGALAEIVSVPLLVIAANVALAAQPGDWAERTWSQSPAVRVIGVLAATAAAVVWALVLRRLSFWVMAAPAATIFTAGASREPSPDAKPF